MINERDIGNCYPPGLSGLPRSGFGGNSIDASPWVHGETARCGSAGIRCRITASQQALFRSQSRLLVLKTCHLVVCNGPMFQAIRGNGKCGHWPPIEACRRPELIIFVFCKCEFILRGKSHVLSQENPLTITTKTLAKGICTPAGTNWLGFNPIRRPGDGEYGCRTLTGLSEPVKGKACGLDQLLVRSSEASPAEAA